MEELIYRLLSHSKGEHPEPIVRGRRARRLRRLLELLHLFEQQVVATQAPHQTLLFLVRPALDDRHRLAGHGAAACHGY